MAGQGIEICPGGEHPVTRLRKAARAGNREAALALREIEAGGRVTLTWGERGELRSAERHGSETRIRSWSLPEPSSSRWETRRKTWELG